MAGSSADNYRRSIQTLLSRGNMQKSQIMGNQSMGMGTQNQQGGMGWPPAGGGAGGQGNRGPRGTQALSSTLMTYMKQENTQRTNLGSFGQRPMSSQDRQPDISEPAWRYCELCDLHFQSQRDYQIHTSGTMHAKKEQESKTSRGFQSQRDHGLGSGMAMHQQQQQQRSGPSMQQRSGPPMQQQKPRNSVFPFPNICKLCNIHTKREQDHAAHMGGKRHAEKFLAKITELGFRDFYEMYRDTPFNFKIDRKLILPNGEYMVPKQAWKILDVPLQYRRQVTEYILRSASLHEYKCKVCDLLMNVNNWWTHVCGKKHTTKCAEVGVKLGWNTYLQLYGSIPLLDHDAVDAIKTGKPYIHAVHDTKEAKSPGKAESLMGRMPQEPRFGNSHQSDENRRQGNEFHQGNEFQEQRSNTFGNDRNRSNAFNFQEEQQQRHQLEAEKERQMMYERQREEEMRRLRMMEDMQMREMEDRQRQEREARLREEQRIREEAMRVEEEKRRLEEEKRRIEEDRRLLEAEQKRRAEERIRQEEEDRQIEERRRQEERRHLEDLRRREEEDRKRRQEEIEMQLRAEEYERRKKEEERRRREEERSRFDTPRSEDPSNMKVEEAVSMVSVLLKGLQQQQPDVLRAAGIRLQDKDSRSFDSDRQERGHQEDRDRDRDRNRRVRSRSPVRDRRRSRSPVRGRFRDDRRSPPRMEMSRESRERREREMWVGGNDEEEFAAEEHPDEYNGRRRSPPRERFGRERERGYPPRGYSPSHRDRPARPPQHRGSPPHDLMAMNVRPAGPPHMQPGNQRQNQQRQNQQRGPQKSILGEPPPYLPRIDGPMDKRAFPSQGPPGMGPTEEDYSFARQVQEMTGLQNLDEIAQAMTVLRSMDPNIVQLVGSLDPSVIQGLVSGGPVAANLQGPMMDQLTHLIQSGGVDIGALQLLTGMPDIFNQQGNFGPHPQERRAPRPLIPNRKPVRKPPAATAGKKPPPGQNQGSGKKFPPKNAPKNAPNKKGKTT